MAVRRTISTLMLVILYLSTLAPQVEAVGGRTAVTEPAALCVPLGDVTEWVADLELSWSDAAEGMISGQPGRASFHRQASTHQQLTQSSLSDEENRWYSLVEEANLSGLIAVDDQSATADGATYVTVGNGSPNDDNFNMATLLVHPDCTYDLQFGFDGDVVNRQGSFEFSGTLLLGAVRLRGLPVPTSLFDVRLTGSMNVPYNSSIPESGSTIAAGFDNGFNGIRSIRGGDTVADAHVSWTLTPANRLPCTQRTTAIDASDPSLEDLHLTVDADPHQIAPNQGNSLTPPEPAKLTIRATCGFAPVRNADIKVGVKAEKNSGGHVHDNGANPRPRGYLRNATGATYTEITADNPTITVRTDATGKAVVYFRPGVDVAAGGAQSCGGKQRGISGLYEVTATPTAARFAANIGKQSVKVARTDFSPLLPSATIQVINGSRHPKGNSGTAASIAALNALAADFNSWQLAYNAGRVADALPAWRVVKLPVVDVSLQDGGLYETQGIDVCQSGQPSAPFRDWLIPHQTHLNGNGADIKTSVWSNTADPENSIQFAWWRNALRALGCNYGTWARERVSFHLNIDQNASSGGSYHSGCQYSPDVVPEGLSTSAAAGLVHSADLQATMPDLFVTLLPVAPEEDVRLAPGQSVTYSVGLNNYYGDAVAHGALLTATLPAGLEFVSSDPPGLQSGNVMTWAVGDLAAHALPVLYFFSVQTGGALSANTTLTVTVQTSGGEAESTKENNIDRSALLITPLGPDLAVDSNLDVVGMTVDGPVTVTLEAANLGNAAAPGTTLRLEMPPATLLKSASLTPTLSGPNFLEWALNSLAADSARTVTVTLALDADLMQQLAANAQSAKPVTVTFATAIEASATDTDPNNNNRTYVEEATVAGDDLHLWIQVTGTNDGVIESGQTLTYTLLYGNFGYQTAYSPTVELLLGEGLRLLNSTPPASGAGALRWVGDPLAVGEVGVIQARVDVDSIPARGSHVSASVFGANPDSNLLNNLAEDVRFAELVELPAGGLFLPSVRNDQP